MKVHYNTNNNNNNNNNNQNKYFFKSLATKDVLRQNGCRMVVTKWS